jgi:hypothetical protein
MNRKKILTSGTERLLAKVREITKAISIGKTIGKVGYYIVIALAIIGAIVVEFRERAKAEKAETKHTETITTVSTPASSVPSTDTNAFAELIFPDPKHETLRGVTLKGNCYNIPDGMQLFAETLNNAGQYFPKPVQRNGNHFEREHHHFGLPGTQDEGKTFHVQMLMAKEGTDLGAMYWVRPPGAVPIGKPVEYTRRSPMPGEDECFWCAVAQRSKNEKSVVAK